MVLKCTPAFLSEASNLCSCHLQLSSSAVDLLNRIFVVDEDHRITIEQVHALPFCLFMQCSMKAKCRMLDITP